MAVAVVEGVAVVNYPYPYGQSTEQKHKRVQCEYLGELE